MVFEKFINGVTVRSVKLNLFFAYNRVVFLFKYFKNRSLFRSLSFLILKE